MKLQAQLDDRTEDVEIKPSGRQLTASVGARKYELEVSEPEPGIFLFKHQGRVYEAMVSNPTENGEPFEVRVGTHEISVRLIDPKRLRGAGAAGEHADGIAEIKTAMPGKVVRILLEPGAEISKGDALLVVEAMKMQNELKSPKNGTVKEVRVVEGATVAAGDILATIE